MRQPGAEIGGIAPLALVLAMAAAAQASCAGSSSTIVELQPQSCVPISPSLDRSITPRARALDASVTPTLLARLYSGALLTDSNNGRWLYPTGASNPCQPFRKGQKVRLRAYFFCCDIGIGSPKCLFGGRFLADLNAPAPYSFP